MKRETPYLLIFLAIFTALLCFYTSALIEDNQKPTKDSIDKNHQIDSLMTIIHAYETPVDTSKFMTPINK